MTDQPEKLDLNSLNLSAEKRQELLDLFPEARTENGKIDFDRLKLALGETVDVGKERYGMNWPGKADCFRAIQTPSTGTLLPCPEESVNFNTTENLIIEGDNLEVLKLLQKSYLGKVKMIYIDPPYNTGNDFIYPDNYSESLQTYLEYTGQVDSEGYKFGTNSDTDGRFHSLWMNMIYPRLFLARNLLRDDGTIFISIDDNEVKNLRNLCDEIFGEENFIAQLIWQKKTGAGARSRGFIVLHEYILCYAKHIDPSWNLSAPMSVKTKSMYNKRDEFYTSLGPYATWPLDTTSMDERPNLRFPIIHEGHEIWPKKQWLWSRERVEKAQKENKLIFNFDKSQNNWNVRFKGYLNDDSGVEREGKPTSLIVGAYTQEGTKDFQEFFVREIFPFPKPVSIIKQLLSIQINSSNNNINENEIFLDFFAGSGTTAHAILELNKEDAGNRKFILVQLPEPCEINSEAGKAGYSTIAEITKERVRRVVKKLNDAEAGQLPFEAPQDRGFRVFKLSPSNFKPWNADLPKDAAALEKQLELHIEHILDGRSQDDILCELLLKSGFPLTTPVESLTLAGKKVFSVAGGELLICLEPDLTMDVIRAMAALKPERVVCLDTGFASNDQLKTNAVEIFKTQGVPSFKTV
jgi:adenine-specific DNA-methyltransferase